MTGVPASPKIYHIVHVDRLASIVADDWLFSDAMMSSRPKAGTVVGMDHIKQRRMKELKLECYHDLHVGECVPFYFCPRSVMLYIFYQNNNADLTYRGGQEPIVHLEADLKKSVEWADQNNLRWAFTLSNAGSNYFEVRNNLDQLHEINWAAVLANNWKDNMDDKQAEFLVEKFIPWQLVERIGVYSDSYVRRTLEALRSSAHKPRVETIQEWYY
ncbi:MAG: DUF4433 domain-containing protein [Nitrospinota bacterium]|nr:DUF4433 domain-containing protein [Nitrospinota bacterium]